MRRPKYRFDGSRLIAMPQDPLPLPVATRPNAVESLFTPPAPADPSVEVIDPAAPPPPPAEDNAPHPLDRDGKDGPGGSLPNPPTDDIEQMTKEQLGAFIASNGGTPPPSNAKKDDFLAAAREIAASTKTAEA